MHFFNSSKKRRIVYRIKTDDRLVKPESSSTENEFIKEVKKLKKTVPKWRNFFAKLDDNERMVCQFVEFPDASVCSLSMISLTERVDPP